MDIAIVSLIYQILLDLQSGSIVATYEKRRQNRSAWCTNCRHELRHCKDSSSAEMCFMAFPLHDDTFTFIHFRGPGRGRK